MPISAHGTGDESTTHCLQEQDNHVTGSNSRPFLKGSWVTEEIKAFIYIKLKSLGDGPQTPGLRVTQSPCFILRFLNLTLPLNFRTRSIGCQSLDLVFLSTLGWFRLTLNFKDHWEMTFFSPFSLHRLFSSPSLPPRARRWLDSHVGGTCLSLISQLHLFN